MSVAKTVIETAPRREMALAFKYASEALNNSFFLDFLVRISPKLSVTRVINIIFRNLLHHHLRKIMTMNCPHTWVLPSDNFSVP